MRRRLAALVLALAAGGAAAQAPQPVPQVVDLPTRAGVQQRLLVLRPAAAPATTVVLLSGGAGRLGIYDNGSLQRDGNFLVRSRQLFVDQGLAVVLVDTPSDQRELRGDFRESAEHAADLGAVVAWARRTIGSRVWVVGTSRGTHSAANAALRLAGESAPDGIVLTATVLDSSRFGTSTARPVQDSGIEKVRLPVLVMHHEQDACQVCPPARLPELMARLPAATSQLLTYTGGRTQGPPCEAFAHHGFNGIEARVVADMVAWIAARS